MIRCTLCHGRIRPPTRPWAAVPGGVHFYRTTSDMDAYTKILVELSKKIPFVHEDCLEDAEPGAVTWPYMIATNLNARMQMQQRRAR